MTLRIGFLTLGLALLATASAAQAFSIDPRCQSMNDKLDCTCALQSGGVIRPAHGQMRWYPPKLDQSAFQKCTQANGGK